MPKWFSWVFVLLCVLSLSAGFWSGEASLWTYVFNCGVFLFILWVTAHVTNAALKWLIKMLPAMDYWLWRVISIIIIGGTVLSGLSWVTDGVLSIFGI